MLGDISKHTIPEGRWSRMTRLFCDSKEFTYDNESQVIVVPMDNFHTVMIKNLPKFIGEWCFFSQSSQQKWPSLGIQLILSENDWFVQSPPERMVYSQFRLHYYSPKGEPGSLDLKKTSFFKWNLGTNSCKFYNIHITYHWLDSHRIHVWYICLHLPYKSTKCR